MWMQNIIFLQKKLNEEVNSSMRSQVEKNVAIKRQNVSSYEISKFFFVKLPYPKYEMQ